MKRLVIIFLGQILFFHPINCLSSDKLDAAKAVLQRTLGTKIAQRFVLKLTDNPNQDMLEYYSIKSKDDTIYIEANSPVALCRASYQYLKNQHNNIINWSGSHIELPDKLKNTLSKGNTPYQYRYYFNVVTHGYTTAYWDWPRWQQEINWMAMHGINMPLMTGAHEAIL